MRFCCIYVSKANKKRRAAAHIYNNGNEVEGELKREASWTTTGKSGQITRRVHPEQQKTSHTNPYAAEYEPQPSRKRDQCPVSSASQLADTLLQRSATSQQLFR